MIVPIAERRNRLPEMGKLKCGAEGEARNGRTRPKRLDTWRVTSANRDALEALAARYGGAIKRTTNRKAIHPLELTTDSDVLHVVLPPDPLGDTPIYEKFGGTGIERRCDGVICHRTYERASGPNGEQERFEEDCPCICIPQMERAAAEGKTIARGDVCSYTTRLSVMFADLQFGGVWTVKTGSELAGDELPAMVEVIQRIAGPGGLALAELRISQRSSSGGRKRYNVPVLHPSASLAEMMAGGGRLASIGAPATPELMAAPEPVPASAPAIGPAEDDVEEAVVVDRRSELRTRVKALKCEDTEQVDRWEAWQTFLRERDEQAWPAIGEMTEMQLDAMERVLNELESPL